VTLLTAALIDLPQFTPQQFGRQRDCVGHGHDGFDFD